MCDRDSETAFAALSRAQNWALAAEQGRTAQVEDGQQQCQQPGETGRNVKEAC